MVADVVDWGLRATLASSAAIVLVLALRPAWRRALGPAFVLWPWLLVPAFLVAISVPRPVRVVAVPAPAPVASSHVSGTSTDAARLFVDAVDARSTAPVADAPQRVPVATTPDTR